MNAGARRALHLALLPGLAAALGFGASNVLGKLALLSGTDVLAMVGFRGCVGVACVWAWLRLSPPARTHTPHERNIALALGLLFAANTFAVFKAIEHVPVPIAVLAYFIYPLLTGVFGALTGLDRLGWRGAFTALAAFAGLALMIGAHAGQLSPVGLGWAFFGAACRTVMLLLQRAALPQADSRLTSGWSLLSSTVVLVLLCLSTQSWGLPQGAVGWGSFLGVSLLTTVAIVALYASTARIGPFRTALVMNLEPVTSILLSALVLGESIGGMQLLGAAVMIASLVAFQFRNNP